MRKVTSTMLALVLGGMLIGCSDERNEVPPEPAERGMINQEMTDRGQERDIISSANEGKPTQEDGAEPPGQGGQTNEQEDPAYLPGAENPSQVREPDARERMQEE